MHLVIYIPKPMYHVHFLFYEINLFICSYEDFYLRFYFYIYVFAFLH